MLQTFVAFFANLANTFRDVLTCKTKYYSVWLYC